MLPTRWKSAGLLFLTLGLSVATPAEPQKPRLDLYGDQLPDRVRTRLGSLRLRHYRASLAFAADSKSLLSLGQSDGVVRTWDVSTGKQLRQVRLNRKHRETERIMYLTLSADGKHIASKCLARDGWRLVLWDAATGKRRRTIELGEHSTQDFTRDFAISTDGRFIAAITGKDEHYALCVWDSATGKKHFQLKSGDYSRRLFFSPNGKLLAELDRESIFMCTVDKGKEVLHKRAFINGLDFSPDGKILAVSMQGKVLLWEIASGKEQAMLRKPDSGNCFALKFSVDGNCLAVCCEAGVALWDIASRRELRTFPDRFADQILFSPDGKMLASCCESVIHLWDVGAGRAIHPRQDHEDLVNGLVVSGDGKTLFSTSWQASGPLQWDLASGRRKRVLDGQPFADGIALSGDGKVLICGAGNRPLVRLWDTVAGKPLRTFTLPLPKVTNTRMQHRLDGFRLSPNGKHLAAIRVSFLNGFVIDRHLAFWDTAMGNLLRSCTLPVGPKIWQSSPYFTPDGIGVVVWQGDDQQGYRLTLQETATGCELLKLPSEPAFTWAFSPDGKTLAVVKRGKTEGISDKGILFGSSEVSLIEIATGKEVLGINMDRSVNHLAFSTDGRMVAASHDTLVSLWDAAKGKCLIPSPEIHFLGLVDSYELLRPDGTQVTTLAFLPRGDALVTGLADGTLLVHDISQARPWTLIEPDVKDEKLASLWSDLADEDPGKAYLASWKLATIPAKSLPLIKNNVHPVPVVDAKKVEHWIADLGSEAFAVRDTASQELMKLGLQAEPGLRRALESKPPLEVRRRIDDLLAAARLADRGLVREREVLRTLRAIQVLERIGTAEARVILQKLADGSDGARATREARESLQRLLGKKGWKSSSNSDPLGGRNPRREKKGGRDSLILAFATASSPIQGVCQSSNIRPATRPNSLVLWVTSVNP